MPTYKRSAINYRKIYEQHHGPIPTDEHGRTYEIHHIDGNRDNNSPDNLQAVSVQQHYDIHLQQGDYAACHFIAVQRLSKTKEEISQLSALANEQRVARGTHNFLGGEMQREAQRRLVDDGSHHLLSGIIQQRSALKRITEGTHNFQDSTAASERNRKRVMSGTHNLLGSNNPSHQRLTEGTHNFLTNHPNKRIVICPHCDRSGGYASMQRWHFNNCRQNHTSSTE